MTNVSCMTCEFLVLCGCQHVSAREFVLEMVQCYICAYVASVNGMFNQIN